MLVTISRYYKLFPYQQLESSLVDQQPSTLAIFMASLKFTRSSFSVLMSLGISLFSEYSLNYLL